MDLLILILSIIAVVGTALHMILWYAVPDYRKPLLFHLSALCGFVAFLLFIAAK